LEDPVPADAAGCLPWLSYVEAHATSRPEQFAVASDTTGQQLTYRQLCDGFRYFAGVLADRGVGQGDHVLVYMDNCLEYVLSFMALHHLGAVVITCSTEFVLDEVRYQINDAKASLVLVDEPHTDAVSKLGLAAGAWMTVRFDASRSDWAGPASPADPAPIKLTDLATVLYTSGTTARPKGVMLNHGNCVFAGVIINSVYHYLPIDTILLHAPLYLTNGQNYQLIPYLMAGATIVMVRRFSVTRFTAQLRRHRITVANLNAAHMKMLLSRLDDLGDLTNSLRLIKLGTAASLDDDQLRQFETRFGAPIVGGTYSQTETITHNVAGPVQPDSWRRSIRGGRPTAGYRVKIVDDERCEVQNGVIGEIAVQSVSRFGICDGYLNDPERTAAAWKDGWWHTGDQGVLDQDGYLSFVDRSKDMIKRSGFNIAPAEVERVLNLHPAIAECSVVGVNDPVKDQMVVAYVVLAEGAGLDGDDLKRHCSGLLATYKVPEIIHPIDELPRSREGKVDKKVLRARAAPTAA
jgi:crotonobetaine/carnitine-CoA ligase